MARVLKEEEHNAKRNEILDYALNLVYTKGYEQMTIQDILDGLQISRGALYHYFDSKQAMLEALVDRMGRQAEQILLPIVVDPHLSAVQKLRRYFEASAQWKSQQKELIVSLLRMWYSEENAYLRQKMATDSIHHAPSLLGPILRQGIEEGVFTTRFPEQTAVIVAGINLSLSDTIIELLLTPHPDQATFQKLDAAIGAFFESIERIVGAPAGSLNVFSADTFKEWFDVI
ncbi:MAG TPA: TetR/AcrR family transcriptional regulator [Anaerolineaceae bacterium]|nr:TetR/AcrR family transcriptional regulator [Anaerolineaceae bacterium]